MLALAMLLRGAQHIATPILVQGSCAQRQFKTAISISVLAMQVMEKLTMIPTLVKHMKKKVVVALAFEVTEPTNCTYASLTPPRCGMR